MVKGLALFAEHFRDHRDRYVLIGGAACDLALQAAGVEFRATKDLDIVLCVETSDTAFAEAFWAFVNLGKYEVREESAGERRLYRFQRPAETAYPAQLELFSSRPGLLAPREGAILTPIPFDGAAQSLSAILLDDVYAAWIQHGRIEVEGVSILAATHLVPLKARAWIDMKARLEADQPVSSADIKKHRNDVFRLAAVFEPGTQVKTPEAIQRDMGAFLEAIAEETVDLKAMGMGAVTMEEVVAMLNTMYRYKE